MSNIENARITSPTGLNIRSAPGGEVLCAAKYNAVVKVLDWDSDETWAKVDMDGTEGYAMKEFLCDANDAPQPVTSPEAPEQEASGGLFANIGDKIKGVTVFFCVMGCLVSVLGGVVMMMNDAVGAGLLTAIVGCAVSYLGSMAMYGFGELICTNQKQNELTQTLIEELRKQK